MNARSVHAYLEVLRAKDEGMDNVAPRASAMIGRASVREWAETELKPTVEN